MKKFILGFTTALSLAVSYGALAQTASGPTATHPQRLLAAPRIFDATARNVGPRSSVTGKAGSELGSAASGNIENPRAPSAGGSGMGGQ